VLAPIRERRERFAEPGYVDRLLVEGTERVRDETVQTVREMKRAMGLSGVWSRIRRAAERREQRLQHR
jgi:tryptophanyl-tRNA synthetase